MRVGRIVAGELAANPDGCGAGKAPGCMPRAARCTASASSSAPSRLLQFRTALATLLDRDADGSETHHSGDPQADRGRRFGAALLSGLPIDGLL